MSTDLLAGLTVQQREAALHREGPLLILAGAGSGKTRTVTRRIANLVQTGVPPEHILAITFTNKAAREMRERVESLLPWSRELPTVSTFHSFAVKILREYADRLGYGPRFAIMSADEQLSLVREAAVEAQLDLKKTRPFDLASQIGRAKERLDDEAYAREARTDVEHAAARILPAYRRLQRQRDGMDFDDLVANAVRLLQEHSDVHDTLLGRIRYVMIDEYQDTNRAQYRLARLLAGERCNLAVCGDPDQSIYSWRGADMGNILRFEEDFPGAKVVLLEQNYRSTATILEVSNKLISHNLVRREKRLLPTAERGGPMEVRRCLDAELEAEFVARQVEQAIKAGTHPSEIAIVYRASILADRYEQALLRKNIPCATSGSISFFDRREIKDALAHIRLGVNSKDDISALRVLKTHCPGVGAKTRDKLLDFQRRRGVSIVEACRRAGQIPGVTPRTKAKLQSFASLVSEIGRAAGHSVEKLVTTAISRSGIEERLRVEDGGSERIEKLKVLVQAARDADRRGRTGTPRDFLDRLALLDSQDQEDPNPDKVTLTTVHAAKGLEWELVFCVAMEEGIFPHRRSIAEGGLEEERRLAYVAFTRARKRLVATYASLRRTRVPSEERRRPSCFLYELPGQLLWDPVREEICELPEYEEEVEETHEAPAAAPGTSEQVPARRLPPRRRPTPKGAARLPSGHTAPRGRALVGAPAGKPAAAKVPLWKRGLVR